MAIGTLLRPAYLQADRQLAQHDGHGGVAPAAEHAAQRQGSQDAEAAQRLQPGPAGPLVRHVDVAQLLEVQIRSRQCAA